MQDVQPGKLMCWLCRKWKVDRCFNRSTYRRRRNRSNRCRACLKRKPYQEDSFEHSFEMVLRASEMRKKRREIEEEATVVKRTAC